ncbi:hypothetical protein J2T02_000038 [Chitinophaga terrae (ex Kim and Jung 2007)]|uniref:hypothetical protein n=1 Tax=Chitinophaga terrae (ex Kim and Jung 2007) TaxID=408074 RepID=UPI00278106E2|nr:hypothetical protein [Chitinophaga terrae (ex Kim and Jung 2007)]MDQ0104955.1 hypothetical protein [Chitinophaga terrae (ex Kim and Jung 2007)]
MRFFTLAYLSIMLFAGSIFSSGCKKDSNAAPAKSAKYQMVTGAWKQQDIVLAVAVKLNKQNIPAGTSILALAPLLGPAGALFTCTVNNTYTFNEDGTFAINGCTDLILPVAGNKGTWEMDVHDGAIKLVSEKGENDPHWIDNISNTNLDLALTVNIPGVATVPLTLKLKK